MTPFVNVLWPTGAFPVVVSASSGGTSSLTSPVPITKPASLAEGNTLLLAFYNKSTTHSGGDGFANLFSVYHTGTTDQHLSVWTKTVTASEAASFDFDVHSPNRAGWWVLQFEGAVAFEYATANVDLDPPNLTLAGGSAKAMWLALLGHGASDSVLTNPSGYTDQVRGASNSSSADSRSACAVARRGVEAASENPGAWAASATAYYPVTATIGVRST